MRAAVVVSDGAHGSLEIRELPDLEPSPGHVVIAVRAAGLNRADLLQRAGRYDAGQTGGQVVVGGMEVAGVVVATGPEVTGVSVGDRVMTMCSGGYAEQVLVDARLVLPVPASVSWSDAAALPVALMTELDALVNAADVSPDETVLVTAAGSGVGAIGVQVARSLGAGLILGTARSAGSAEVARHAGADAVLDGNNKLGLARAVRGATDQIGVGVVIDHVGADLLAANLDALALGGRLVSVGRLGGKEATISLDQLARNRLRLIGTTFRTRNVDQRAAIAEQVKERLIMAVADGTIRPRVSAVYALEEALAAQEDMRTGYKAGKIVLLVGSR